MPRFITLIQKLASAGARGPVYFGCAWKKGSGALDTWFMRAAMCMCMFLFPADEQPGCVAFRDTVSVSLTTGQVKPCLWPMKKKGEGRRNGSFGHKLNSRAWANLTDLPIIVFRSPMEFCPFSFRAYTHPLEIHCAVK